MNGTTLCPHCNTRFKIVEAQLEVHHGMVRCGHCLQAFDARPNFIPDQPNPQLELPILDEAPTSEAPEPDISELALGEDIPGEDTAEKLTEAIAAQAPELPDQTTFTENDHDVAQAATPQTDESSELAEPPPHEPLDFSQTNDASRHEALPEPVVAPFGQQPLPPTKTLAEQVAIIEDEYDSAPPAAARKWPWALAALLCLLLLVGQAAYFFRVDLAARLPGLKPGLVASCQLLRCSVPLPQKSELMSIESSGLEADPALENQITLNALLRNRATFSQAFPHLELTLNDTQDKPLARLIFKPADYLPPLESEKFGLLPNHELGIKLHLDVADLKPTGYRLVLFYPNP